MRTGRCLCTGTRYEFDTEPTDASFCHCLLCRRMTGSAFAAWCEVPREDLRWTSGTDGLSAYRVTDRLQILFCRVCSTTMAASHSSWPDCLYLPLGTLDDDHHLVPEYHQFTDSKAPWYEIHDALTQYPRWPQPDQA